MDDIHGGTYICARITDARGCKTQKCITVSYGGQCSYSIGNGAIGAHHVASGFNLDFRDIIRQLHATNSSLNQYNGTANYIGTCQAQTVCELGLDYGPLIYEPYDADNPCTGGGLLKCDLCGEEGNEYWMDVPSNFAGEQITIDGACMCLFPPGVIINDKFLAAVNTSLTNDPWSQPVLVFYDCETEGGGGTTGPPTGPESCSDIIPGCENCIFEIIPGVCGYDVYCDGDENPTDHIEAFRDCIRIDECTLYRQCYSDPCIGLDLPLLECDGGCNEDEVNSYLPWDFQLDCGDDNICSCEELVNLLGACLLCGPLGESVEHQSVKFAKTQHNLRSINAQIQNREPFENNLKVFPNPFQNQINIQLELEEAQSGTIIINDLFGKQIMSQVIAAEKGINNFDLSLEVNIPNGVYFLSLELENSKEWVQKIAKFSK